MDVEEANEFEKRIDQLENSLEDIYGSIECALEILQKLNESGQSLKLKRAIELLEDVV